MDIVVTQDAETRHRGLCRIGARDIPCALGRGGITVTKEEGDGATPAGQFALRRVLYRADRVGTIESRLPAQAIGKDDGWCDDPARPEYNRPVNLPFGGSAERLWRQDALYDVVVVIGHNDDPPEPGAGSAIFLHVARDDFGPTEGCVAIERAALIELVRELAPGDAIVIGPS